MISGDKPHSSISDWIEILSSSRYTEDDYEGIIELVESINLQPTGPTEASRAIRKKLKYGDVHRQLRALTILKALVENCGTKFQTSFANDRLTERIKSMASDPMTDEQVKKKLMSVLASWYRQFKDDPKMSLVAGLYHSCGGGSGKKPRLVFDQAARSPYSPGSHSNFELQQKKAKEAAKLQEERRLKGLREKEEAKRKAKEEKKKQATSQNTKRKPFNFEQEKPQIVSSISTASQASNNLVNALKLVNREQESIERNARVQEYLAQAKAAGKVIVRYIQLVENEEYIGTLIDSNERVIAALEFYDHMLKGADQDSDDSDLANKMDRVSVSESEISKRQDKQRAKERNDSMDNLFNGTPGRGVTLHPDLQDLTFGELGASQTALPPPMRPDATVGDNDHDVYDQRGTLSDYSDYVSSDEETPNANVVAAARPSNSNSHDYHAPDPTIPIDSTGGKDALIDFSDDPFADPTDVSASAVRPVEQRVFLSISRR
ncbi:uncharacterized protein EI90DRAFT_3144360 [Cantharellus anzutake]|uniref:uncharacterized protein n=1 Tax=Cantharellus anzutake TaxID=1750568 RepID=UPI001906F26B|nr:uncharacterized protein EI90DRAFT_3144360 [Cantharellus anzutake]KAF8338027.1 hypothetical protein EI90DRAFT_3144360 [Cantharellus anzutake]